MRQRPRVAAAFLRWCGKPVAESAQTLMPLSASRATVRSMDKEEVPE
jgi:hypothetical protein